MLLGFQDNFEAHLLLSITSYHIDRFWLFWASSCHGFRPVFFSQLEFIAMKVFIENDRGRLRLKVSTEGKRRNISLGLPDTPVNRLAAQKLASQIELDYVAGHFDETLLRYKPRHRSGSTGTEVTVPVLFEQYVKAITKSKNLCPGSLSRYQGCLSHLKKSLNINAELVSSAKADHFVVYLRGQVCERTAKEYLWMLKACWVWASGKYHISSPNPWDGLTDEIKPQPRQPVKPFTSDEVTRILLTFSNHRYYSYYADFVTFLFGSGCRFGEVAALRWKHFSANFSVVWIGESASRGNRKSTKTGKAREVVLSPKIREMLKNRLTLLQPNSDDLVFPSRGGKEINDREFRRRAWTTVLSKCGIEYRKPYATRHTAISHALADGANPFIVAAQSGHDLQVLLKHYASVIESRSIFKEF